MNGDLHRLPLPLAHMAARDPLVGLRVVRLDFAMATYVPAPTAVIMQNRA